MTLRLLPLALLLAGCTFGSSGPDVFQAEGVTVVLVFQERGIARELEGELLTVDADGFLVDAVSDAGAPVRVATVPYRAILRGEVYTGRTVGVAASGPSPTSMSPEQRVRADRHAPTRGPRRIARLRHYGDPKEAVDLRALSRFPEGIPPALLARLLAARGQDAVLPHTEAPSRVTSL